MVKAKVAGQHAPRRRLPSKSFVKWRRIDKQRGGQTAFFSVVQGSPYESPFEKDMREAKESRRQWVTQASSSCYWFTSSTAQHSTLQHRACWLLAADC